MDETLTGFAESMRNELKQLEDKARDYKTQLSISDCHISWDKWEYIAQATIAIRHIEDARMRYWKVIQYLGDGVSKFDK